jgi:hypothetical protein
MYMLTCIDDYAFTVWVTLWGGKHRESALSSQIPHSGHSLEFDSPKQNDISLELTIMNRV